MVRANALQFELLDQSTRCADESQREWWQKTGPLLASLMSWAGYTSQSQRQCLIFYHACIVPYLGPYPQTFPSAMTHNELPLELSINFQQRGGASPVIRVAVEPLTSVSGTSQDPYNLSPIRDFLSRLEQLDLEGYDSRVFEHFYPQHTLSERECRDLQARNEAIRELSQVSFGFDLKPDGIAAKGYTFPALKCHAAGTDLCSVVLGSVRAYLGAADRYNTLGLMQEYIETTDARDNFGFVFSHDCAPPEQSRFKLYGRTKDISWDRVREIWTLGGRIDSSEASTGLEYLHQLWTLLRMDEPHPLGLHLVWNYETKAGLTAPATKIYFPLYGLNDQSNVRAVAQYLTHIGLEEYGNAYEQAVRDTFPGLDIRQTDRLICWVSFAYTESRGVYLSVYYHSSLEYPWLSDS
ncbi:putative tryptophan dimethylallyltransferase [Aspergillus steynii IBT 23096]|uniref:Putative tryptophan dimethylallyltransferase n=1 Tax=Aspergillus steynii IBT 23096 TaxID=1392250 RepID=A0A2I2GBT5_9EURO|nr:putative tryptophan dimethylallyltransferase [Aspergillus steynii IBT 23096]PLB50336.1 putative tryptophan dimethylallyltransferase [Aspergillus steynii IBT 23096]